MVDPASGKVPRAPPYSGTASKRHIHVAYGDFTLSVRPSQTFPLYICFFSTLRVIPMRPYNPRLIGFGLFRFRSPLLSESLEDRSSSWFLFLKLLRWFTSLSFALLSYFIQIRNDNISVAGLPHSAIRESQNVCFSPRLFAAYHGLLRLTAPRHPP